MATKWTARTTQVAPLGGGTAGGVLGSAVGPAVAATREATVVYPQPEETVVNRRAVAQVTPGQIIDVAEESVTIAGTVSPAATGAVTAGGVSAAMPGGLFAGLLLLLVGPIELNQR